MTRVLNRLMPAALIGLCLLVAACSSSGGPVATQTTLAAPSQINAVQDYRIGALDKLNITVFQVKDLTLEKVQVDASGRLVLPLVGVLVAAGRTPEELASDIAIRLRESYMQSPQVSVQVQEAAGQKVTVDGAVMEAGVFELRGQTSLLQAVAMAKGPARDANLRRVAIFRQINGRREAAVFDLAAIRKGQAEDPTIYGNDVIVVDGSAVKGIWREVVGALPALSIFRPY